MAKKKYIISKERLRNLYSDKKLSLSKIAEIFNCTSGTIVYRMKEYNINRRCSGPKRINASPDVLYSLYVKKGFSANK